MFPTAANQMIRGDTVTVPRAREAVVVMGVVLAPVEIFRGEATKEVEDSEGGAPMAILSNNKAIDQEVSCCLLSFCVHVHVRHKLVSLNNFLPTKIQTVLELHKHIIVPYLLLYMLYIR